MMANYQFWIDYISKKRLDELSPGKKNKPYFHLSHTDGILKPDQWDPREPDCVRYISIACCRTTQDLSKQVRVHLNKEEWRIHYWALTYSPEAAKKLKLPTPDLERIISTHNKRLKEFLEVRY
ncbi:hypothetical protein HY490_04550 [Candidatus Woesearchaeota archaeon]|nr:hypothetical protein [Candidatus Woesearchaeota archaeon]